ncbi:uncharacterized protein LOC144728136 isoform X1 [Lampetra planeri]
MAYSSIPILPSVSTINKIIFIIFIAFHASVLSHPPRSLTSSSFSPNSSSPFSSSSVFPTPRDLAHFRRSKRQVWPFKFDVLGLARTVVGYAIKFAYEDPRADRWQQEWRNFAQEMRGSAGFIRHSLLSLPSLLERVEAHGEWLHVRATLRSLLSRLRVFHHPLAELQGAGGALHPRSAETWATNAIDPTSGIFAALLDLNALILDSDAGGGGDAGGRALYAAYAHSLVAHRNEGILCHAGTSRLGAVASLHVLVQGARLQALEALMAAYNLAGAASAANFTAEMLRKLELFEGHTAQQETALRSAARSADDRVLACGDGSGRGVDSSGNGNSDKTHTLFTVFQGIQLSEARLGDGSCMGTCETSHRQVLPPAQPRARHCEGILLECQDSWDYVGLNLAPSGDWRRILAMGNIWGPKESAAERWGQKTVRLPTWEEVSGGGSFAGDYAYTRWFWRCRPCFCICEDPWRNTAEFDLGEVRSDTERGMVVTGVAMQASTLMDERGSRTRVRLEVRQGRSRPFGHAEPSEPRWRRATGSRGTNFETRSRSDDANEHIQWNGTEATLAQTYSVSREQRRATIDLQDVRVDPGCVLTGVAFFERGKHLALKVHQTPIEPDTGRLRAHEGRWKEPPPTVCSFPSTQGLELPPSWSDGHVERGPCAEANMEFAWSSKEQDVAQSTLPAIDTRLVAPDEDVWRYGAGLHYAARQGFAGSIGVSLLDRPDCGGVNVGSEWTDRFSRGRGEDHIE